MSHIVDACVDVLVVPLDILPGKTIFSASPMVEIYIPGSDPLSSVDQPVLITTPHTRGSHLRSFKFNGNKEKRFLTRASTQELYRLLYRLRYAVKAGLVAQLVFFRIDNLGYVVPLFFPKEEALDVDKCFFTDPELLAHALHQRLLHVSHTPRLKLKPLTSARVESG